MLEDYIDYSRIITHPVIKDPVQYLINRYEGSELLERLAALAEAEEREALEG